MFGCVVVGSTLVFLVIGPRKQIAGARKVAAIFASEQTPFWLTSPTGNIALSNLSLTPPSGSQWLSRERTTLLFLQHVTARFTIDAFSGQLIWQNPNLSDHDRHLSPGLAAQIFTDLLARDPRYLAMVGAFVTLSQLEDDLRFLNSLAVDAERGLTPELRQAEERVEELRRAQQKPPESHQAKEEPKRDIAAQPLSKRYANASWDSLVIPQSLREKLRSYVKILRDFEAYQDKGVFCPRVCCSAERRVAGKRRSPKS
jgi:hypothetical protein